MIETGAMMMIPVFNNISEYFDQLISLFSVGFILVEMKVEFWLSAIILIVNHFKRCYNRCNYEVKL